MGFHHYRLDNGLNLYVQPTAKFKSVMLKVFWHQNLDEAATLNALLPMVLKRGTGRNPTTQGFNRLLEELYGAEFDARVLKKGERQIIEFELDLVKDSLVQQPLLERGLELLHDVILDPVVVAEGFDPDFLAQEKDQLRQIIEGIFNDKVQYSIERCLEEMGRGERFGLSRYGKVEEFPRISPGDLYRHYLERRNSAPMDIFVLGDLNPVDVYKSVNRIFSFPHQGGYTLQPVELGNAPVQAKEIVERQEINQGKLSLAYRTGTAYGDPIYPALAVYSGVLGGFPHSKLFQNVREKASLAYYATCRLEKSKGVLLVTSGIEFANYAKARRIIEEQVADMATGNISDVELDNTKKGLLHQLRASNDNYHLMVDMALDGLVNGRPRSSEELAEQIRAVSKADVVQAAERIRLDTVYFLTNSEGAGLNE